MQLGVMPSSHVTLYLALGEMKMGVWWGTVNSIFLRPMKQFTTKLFLALDYLVQH